MFQDNFVQENFPNFRDSVGGEADYNRTYTADRTRIKGFCFRRTETCLLLCNRTLIAADHGGVDLVGHVESRTEANVRVFGVEVLFHEQLQNEARDVHPVECNRVDIHIAEVPSAVSVRDHNHIMHT